MEYDIITEIRGAGNEAPVPLLDVMAAMYGDTTAIGLAGDSFALETEGHGTPPPHETVAELVRLHCPDCHVDVTITSHKAWGTKQGVGE